MADYILLESADKRNQVRVVVHTAIALNEVNAVGVEWRDAIVGWVGDTTSVVPDSVLPAGIQAKLDIGALYEWQGTVEFDANLPDDVKWVDIETWVATRDTIELTRMQSILEFYGKTGTV